VVSPVGEINSTSKSSAKSFQRVINSEFNPRIIVKSISNVFPVLIIPAK